MMAKLSGVEKSALIFIIPANIFYSIAALTHEWFELPPHSYYGLWWAKFCDVLRCQIIPAFFTEEPLWYHFLQSFSIIGWMCLVISLLMLTTKHLDRFMLDHSPCANRSGKVSVFCFASVFAISTSLILFYTKLKESSIDGIPQISWSAILAALSCLCQLSAGVLLLDL